VCGEAVAVVQIPGQDYPDLLQGTSKSWDHNNHNSVTENLNNSKDKILMISTALLLATDASQKSHICTSSDQQYCH
jgi:hypothetical protein